jgi:pimeloyl-ACP methyl ester carboxylesterase
MRRPGARRIALRDVMTRGDQMPADEAVQLVRSSVACTVVDEVFATIRSGTGLMRDMDKIDCPVLVCWGSKDRILPLAKHGPRFRDEIPGVEFRVWKGLGHTPMWDDPALIAGTIADFAAAAESKRAIAPVSAG